MKIQHVYSRRFCISGYRKVINSSQYLGLIISSKEWLGRKWADVLTFDCFMWGKRIKNH